MKVGHQRSIPVDEHGPTPEAPNGRRGTHGAMGRAGLITLDPTEPRRSVIGATALPVQEIARLWRDAVRRSVGSSGHVSVLFSGGLDSSLVARTARELAGLELVTVGVSGSHDLTAAEDGARELSLPWRPRTIGPPDVDRMWEAHRVEVEGVRPASRAVLIGLALAVETTNTVTVLCGQGADELFLGYAHFSGRAPGEVESRRAADLDKLRREDWPAIQSISGRLGKRIESPFLDHRLMSYVLQLPIGTLQAGGERKRLLRRVALDLGVPERLAARDKKAFQYGSGIERLVRAKRSGV